MVESARNTSLGRIATYGSGGADAEFNAGLVRGYGKAYETAHAKELDDLLLKILQEMPIRLVQ